VTIDTTVPRIATTSAELALVFELCNTIQSGCNRLPQFALAWRCASQTGVALVAFQALTQELSQAPCCGYSLKKTQFYRDGYA
jgi:hypothetical protein